MTDFQQKLLNMLEWFHSFCIEHKLTYFAVGGTLLGAVRHKGFIPWDDDIDVGMPRSDYNKLIEIVKNGLPENSAYAFETPFERSDFVYQYCKLYDTNTLLTENNRYKTRRGIFLDVFPFDGIGNSLEESRKNFKEIDKKNNYIMTKVCSFSKRRKFYKNLAIFCSRLLPFPSWRKVSIKLDNVCSSRVYEKFDYVANLYGNWHEKEIVKREWIGTPKLYRFENIDIFGPQDAHSYLTAIYGDYLVLPPIDKQKSHHDYLEFDLNKSYLV